MTAPEFSSALVQWAASAGYALTPQDPSGAAVFWTDPGGEIRSYIRSSSDGYTITTAERASDEQFDLFAPSMETIERYLVSKFATRVRSRRGLPRLKIPTTVDSIAPGYRSEMPTQRLPDAVRRRGSCRGYRPRQHERGDEAGETLSPGVASAG